MVLSEKVSARADGGNPVHLLITAMLVTHRVQPQPSSRHHGQQGDLPPGRPPACRRAERQGTVAPPRAGADEHSCGSHGGWHTQLQAASGTSAKLETKIHVDDVGGGAKGAEAHIRERIPRPCRPEPCSAGRHAKRAADRLEPARAAVISFACAMRLCRLARAWPRPLCSVQANLNGTVDPRRVFAAMLSISNGDHWSCPSWQGPKQQQLSLLRQRGGGAALFGGASHLRLSRGSPALAAGLATLLAVAALTSSSPLAAWPSDWDYLHIGCDGRERRSAAISSPARRRRLESRRYGARLIEIALQPGSARGPRRTGPRVQVRTVELRATRGGVI